MSKTHHSGFSRGGPDILTEELAVALSGGASFEFRALFEIIHPMIRARKAANGGEEMLRLRTYEKLQSLVYRGMVAKIDKKYRGLVALASALPVVPILPSLEPA
jgi:hypothetical protein